MNRTWKVCLAFTVALNLISICDIHAQGISGIDFQSLDTDAMSDEQIQSFAQKIQSSGLSQVQLEALARQRGVSEEEISKLRKRILQINFGLSQNVDEMSNTGKSRLRGNTLSAQEKDISEEHLHQGFKEKKKFGIFGLKMFQHGKTTFQSMLNIPTPKNYVLGAGDELIIDVYGASEKNYRQEISPDGQIIIPGIGPINVSGITVEVARAKIFRHLTNIYAGLRGSSPNTFVQITVGNIRTIKVNLLGQVARPGTYSLNSFSNIFDALYLAGGPTEFGSLRSIRLIREGELLTVFDAYQYLFEPKVENNVILQDGDHIIVDAYLNRVSLTGSVKYSAKYELVDGETFESLMRFSGGFGESAFREFVTVERKNGRMKSIVLIRADEFKTALLQNGDSVHVGAVMDRFDNRISISGAVMRPGNYEFTQGMMLSDLLKEAHGAREDAFKGRANISRQNEDLTLKNIAFDLNAVVEGSQDILLKNEDMVIIPSIFDLRKKLTIEIAGEVRVPGIYPYLSEMTVEDLIGISGGFKESASKSIVEVARQVKHDKEIIGGIADVFIFKIDENLSLTESASTFELMPFDVVLIKRSPFYQEQKLVKIEGEVLYPGYYALERRGDKVSDIIERSGGLTEFAYTKGATVLRRTEFQSQYSDIIDGNRRGNDLTVDQYRSERLKELQELDSIPEFDSELRELASIGINLEESLKYPGSEYDLILKEGDVISVPRELQTVRVRGHVLYPNTVLYEPGEGFRRIISKVGGFTDNARSGKSYVVYANGSAQRTKGFLFFKNYPNIEPGAEVIVPRRLKKLDLSNLNVIAGISSSFATLILIITQINF